MSTKNFAVPTERKFSKMEDAPLLYWKEHV